MGVGRQFSRFADGHYGFAELVGQRRTEQKPAGLDGHDHIQAMGLVAVRQQTNGIFKGARILKQGRNVSEENTRLGEIGYVSYVGL